MMRRNLETDTRQVRFTECVPGTGRARAVCIAVWALAIAFAGCTMKANRGGIPPQAQAVIEAVGKDIADGRYQKIYEEAADEWRSATTLEASNATFRTLKDKLGGVTSRTLHSASEQDTTADHTFVIIYKTVFERAEGMETFTLVERDGRWLLARYFVNSNELG